jgi:hypothetical protein
MASFFMVPPALQGAGRFDREGTLGSSSDAIARSCWSVPLVAREFGWVDLERRSGYRKMSFNALINSSALAVLASFVQLSVSNPFTKPV